VFFVFDRLAFGLLPPFLRAWLRFGRVGRLRRAIAANPHDRPARWELAQILIERRRHQEAARVIAPNLVAGDADAATLIVAGQALAGMGRRADAEHYFTDAREAATPHERDEIDLLAGTNRAAMGTLPAPGKRSPPCARRASAASSPASASARVLAAAGEREAAARMRDEAWARYREAPRFQRRRERFLGLARAAEPPAGVRRTDGAPRRRSLEMGRAGRARIGRRGGPDRISRPEHRARPRVLRLRGIRGRSGQPPGGLPPGASAS
jgi:tetratricopeptide (TPR) repeat protein